MIDQETGTRVEKLRSKQIGLKDNRSVINSEIDLVKKAIKNCKGKLF